MTRPTEGAARLSVIVPVHNGAETLETCLRPLLRSAGPDVDIVVVDDRSSDRSASLAAALGVRVIANPRGRGPAAARNVGAEQARGDVLLFVDADVVVQETTIAQVLSAFDLDPDLAAVFGSYDDLSEASNFLSQYKNLFHHFTHQTSEATSCSFWGGCGAVRREAFEAVGGFDEKRYPRASIEDIELGVRLNRAKYLVRLDPTLQVKHLKRWTLGPLIRSEILDRAYPWSRLLVSADAIPDDLNLRWSARISAAMVGVLALAIPFLLLGHRRFYGVPVFDVALIAALAALAHVLLLNRQFYLFLLRARGALFTVRAIPLHLCYYFYSGVTFVVCWVREQLRRVGATGHRNRATPAASE